MTIKPNPPVPHAAPAKEPAEQDEQQFVAALQRGDQDAFATLVRERGRTLLSTLRRMLGNEHDARDCLQETFLSAFRALDGFESKCRLGTWLHRIAVNTALMKLRSRRSGPEVSIDELVPRFSADGHHENAPIAWEDDSIEMLERRENRELLRQAIDTLPAAYREVVVLRDIEGLSTEETGDLLGITPNAAKIRLHRARQALRTMLDRHIRESVS